MPSPFASTAKLCTVAITCTSSTPSTGAFAVDRPVSPVALDYRIQTRRERSLARAGAAPAEPRTGAAGR